MDGGIALLLRRAIRDKSIRIRETFRPIRRFSFSAVKLTVQVHSAGRVTLMMKLKFEFALLYPDSVIRSKCQVTVGDAKKLLTCESDVY